MSVRFLDAAHEELVEAHRFYDEAGAGVVHAFVVEVADIKRTLATLFIAAISLWPDLRSG